MRLFSSSLLRLGRACGLGFALAVQADFALKPDSPAWALGVQQIPVDQIGLREDEMRRAVGRLGRALEE
jgi:hypothetical protein